MSAAERSNVFKCFNQVVETAIKFPPRCQALQNDDTDIAFDDGWRMTHDLEIRHCRVLLAVSEHGSVSAAARELGLAQSTISETLLSLERVIGAPIILRRPGKEAVLTTAAETLLPHARGLIAASVAALAAVSIENRGIIRLGAVESVSSFILPKVLTEFRSRWPSVEVQINIGLCDKLRERVRHAELDAAVTLDGSENALRYQDGCSRRLSPAQLRFVVARRPPRGTRNIRRTDLIGRTFLLPDPDGAFPALLRAWFGASVQHPRFESAGSIDGVKSGVQNSDVVGVLPNYTVGEELAIASLFELKVREPLPAIAVGLTMQRQPLEASPLHDMIQQIERSLDTHKGTA
jgi:molybdate transport repressor ModE-like protein